MIAFTNYDFQHLPPNKLLDWVGLTNFTNIWSLSTFRSAFGSVLSWTIIWALAASTLQIVIGIFTAIIANQPFIKGKRIFGVIFLLPWAVPAFITILTFSNMFNDSVGAINTQVLPILAKFLPFLDGALIPWKTDPTWTKIALIMMQGWLGFPYIYVLTLGILQSIPNDLYEAAYIDGAGHFRRFWQIVLPLVRPMVAVQALWAFMGPFGDYILSSFLLREKEYFTVAVGLQTFVNNAKNLKIAYFSAGAILIALPICILFFFLQKNFVSGLTSGGDKG
ncbi:ABC transporter permease subunit [Streptococcus pneumoniae]|nr:ABC transporter permease subunit [Streptococcus pneumoniae]